MYDREVKETGAYVFNRSSPGGLNLSGINGMSHICLRMSRFSFCMLRVFVLERVGSINAPRQSSTKDIYLCFDTALNSSRCISSCWSFKSWIHIHGFRKTQPFWTELDHCLFCFKTHLYVFACLLNHVIQVFLPKTCFSYFIGHFRAAKVNTLCLKTYYTMLNFKYFKFISQFFFFFFS